MNLVIYYPHLFPPMDWLRVAALCWDEVYTLRPPGSPSAPDELLALDSALGGVLRIEDVTPHYADTDFLEKFKCWLEGFIRGGGLTRVSWDTDEDWFALLQGKMHEDLERLLHEHSLTKYDFVETPVRVTRWMKREVESSKDGEWIQTNTPRNPHGKLYRRYLAILEQVKHALDPDEKAALRDKAEEFCEKNSVKAIRRDGYVFLPREIGYNYLSLLASKISDVRRTDVATIDDEFAATLFHDVRSTKGAVATALLEANLPQNFDRFDPKHIAEFRNDFAASRLKYQTAIQDLVGQFENTSSEDSLARLRRQILEIAGERVQEVGNAYKRGKVDLAAKSLAITLTPPALAATLASMLHIGLFAPAGIAAALSLFSAQAIFDARKLKTERNRSGWSYIFDVRNAL